MNAVCLQCGIPARASGGSFCRRCGLVYGERPRAYMEPTCPVCYQLAGSDGRFEALGTGHERVDLVGHMEEHDRHPVGDDEYLESLRQGDDVCIGRWRAPYDLVRRYLVLGVLEAGRGRRALHNALLTAMGQLARWDAQTTIVGDQPAWAEARAALAEVMERYHARSGSQVRPMMSMAEPGPERGWSGARR